MSYKAYLIKVHIYYIHQAKIKLTIPTAQKRGALNTTFPGLSH